MNIASKEHRKRGALSQAIIAVVTGHHRRHHFYATWHYACSHKSKTDLTISAQHCPKPRIIPIFTYTYTYIYQFLLSLFIIYLLHTNYVREYSIICQESRARRRYATVHSRIFSLPPDSSLTKEEGREKSSAEYA